MKTENNENEALNKTDVKCRFFAQYYKQKVMYVGGVGTVKIGESGWNLKHPDFFLQLKPISKLDIDDIEFIMSNFLDNPLDKETCDYEELAFQIEDLLTEKITDIFLDIKLQSLYSMVDYLRSKGYALPFMDLSIEDLVSFGWVQLV